LPTQKNSSGIATLAARLAARGFLDQADTVVYLVQTNEIDLAHKVAGMMIGQFVNNGKSVSGQVRRFECGYATVFWATGESTDEPIETLTTISAPYRIYSKTKGYVKDCGTVLDYAVQLFYECQATIQDAELMEYNGQEWQQVR
jgi:hypothetical protein